MTAPLNAVLPVTRAAELDRMLERSRQDSKPDLTEMRSWVGPYEAALIQAAETYHSVYGEFDPKHVRLIVVVRQLLRFIEQCTELQDDIETVFRAAAHRNQWKKRA
ncbi:hypothetical protein LGH83_04460 [Lichenihabitans sp. PAMC28606]|uniref:hypothetical protein n=1 Tax=Lichenihabitans sp. PAMC28606 TaxID=2880932 RepID=UPI001D0A5A11|nr:hypothetical protein [Lichenihabitans sp. PAMC28606]UDL95479.1 hypothetical protein LGH83_04460 [Lichenihabitans sp. PAMC28606]